MTVVKSEAKVSSGAPLHQHVQRSAHGLETHLLQHDHQLSIMDSKDAAQSGTGMDKV